jgi:predicted RNase H-like HicB family nuclease
MAQCGCLSPPQIDSIYSGEAMIVHVTLEPAEDGWIVAQCPALPGCVSQGKDEEEAMANIKEAITAWMLTEDQQAIESLAPDKNLVMVMV